MTCNSPNDKRLPLQMIQIIIGLITVIGLIYFNFTIILIKFNIFNTFFE